MVLSGSTILTFVCTSLWRFTSRWAVQTLGLIITAFVHVLASRARATVPLARSAEGSVLTWNAVTGRIVIVDIIRVVDNEIVGRTKLALEIIGCSAVLVSSSAANFAQPCCRRVLIRDWTVLAGDVLHVVISIVNDVASNAVLTRDGEIQVRGVLILASWAHGAMEWCGRDENASWWA